MLLCVEPINCLIILGKNWHFSFSIFISSEHQYLCTCTGALLCQWQIITKWIFWTGVVIAKLVNPGSAKLMLPAIAFTLVNFQGYYFFFKASKRVSWNDSQSIHWALTWCLFVHTYQLRCDVILIYRLRCDFCRTVPFLEMWRWLHFHPSAEM